MQAESGGGAGVEELPEGMTLVLDLEGEWESAKGRVHRHSRQGTAREQSLPARQRPPGGWSTEGGATAFGPRSALPEV